MSEIKLTLELENEVGTMGVDTKCWVFRLNGEVVGKCEARDNPNSPSFWFLEQYELEGQHTKRQKLADAYMFLTRLL